MITEASAVNFGQNPGEMLDQVQYRNDSVARLTNDTPQLTLDAQTADEVPRPYAAASSKWR